MRVLLVVPRIPWPPHQGTAIRNLAIALELAKRHEVTLLGFAALASDSGPLDAAGVRIMAVPPPSPRSQARRALDIPTTAMPDLARRLDSEAFEEAGATLAATVAAEGRPFDVVQIEGLEMATHGLALLAELSRLGTSPRVIYDAHNAEWVLQDRAWRADKRHPRTWLGALYSRVQTAKLRRFERVLLTQVDTTIAVSEADAAALRAVAPHASIAVVPNGVSAADASTDQTPGPVKDGTCLFIGKMDFRPNVDAMVWLAAEVWPLVRRAMPTARLWIVGQDPTERVKALHNAAKGIEVVGAVPDVAPWLARAAMVVVPLRIGGGTRLKVLEAMVAGKAIAATTMAVEGLDVRDEQEALLADEPAELSAAIVRLLGDEALRARLSTTARQTALEHYRWSNLVPTIEALFEPASGS